jgi:flagellar hook assembly protein FlgD
MDGNWLDSSGNGNDGTAMNGVTFTTDARVGPYSGSFDGSNDYVTLVNAQSLRPTVFTIEAWVKAASSVTASSVIFSSFDYLSGHDAGFHLGLNYNVGDGKVWLDIANNAGQRDRVLSSMGEYNDNTWHQVVGTYDGSYIKVYIDGVLKGNLAWAYSPVYTASNNVSIGARSYANTTDMYFTGRIDEAALYNRALNADEVTGLYNLTAPLVTILSPTAGITNNNKPLLSYTVSSGVVMVKVDGNIVSTVSGSNLDLVSDGTHTVRVEAVNSAGVMVFAEVVFTVDTVPPAFGIDPVVTPTHSGSQTITGTRESGTVISVSVNTSATIGTVIYPTLTTWSCDLSSLTPGVNNVTVTARDAAGNSPSITTSIERLAFSITGVGVNANILDVSQGGTTNIFFTIDAPATVTLKVFAAITDPTMSPIYQTSRNCSSAGAQLFTWDGKNNAGNVVPDEAYLYVLEASDGAVSATYNPSAPTGTGTVTCSQDSFNPYKNDPMTISYSVSPAARVDIKITSGLNTFTIMNSIAHAVGSYTYDWDGRDQNGAIVSDGSIASCFITRLLRENHIVTTGNTPKITFVRTDPYDIHLSYGQFTRIKYNLSGAANVSVQLISPSGTTMTLIDNQPQAAGLNEVDWKGFADPSERLLTVKEDGVFTFLVRAVNPVTGSQSQSRGTLTIGY